MIIFVYRIFNKLVHILDIMLIIVQKSNGLTDAQQSIFTASFFVQKFILSHWAREQETKSDPEFPWGRGAKKNH